FIVNGRPIPHTLRNTLHVPDAKNNLWSIGKFDEAGGKTQFMSNKCKLISAQGHHIGTGMKKDRLYYLDAYTLPSGESANLATTPLNWDEWH
ncbi:hypothetical protein BD410DRAFT_680168, partial [Rickenella mellea]